LFKSITVYEVIEIEAVDTGGVTLTTTCELAWPTRSQVFPVGVCVLGSNVPVNRQSSQHLNGSVSFIAAPVSGDPFVPAAAATDLYNGVEVILKTPDFYAPIDNTATFDFNTVDFNTGDRAYALTDTIQSLAYKYRWIFKTRASVNTFKAFLGRLKGQLNAVYIPSWHDDFTLVQDVQANDVAITVIDRNFFYLVGSNPARANLYIRTRQHGNFLRPIATIALSGTNVVIGIGTALGVLVPVSDVIQIAYVSLYRKSSDASTIQWQTDQIAIVEETFQLVDA